MSQRDKELLMLAAKAYWGEEIDDVVSVEWSEPEQAILYTHGENQDHNGKDVTLVWNPLIDDGDALRIAVKLHMDINSYPCSEEIGAVQHRHNKICKGNEHRMFERTWNQDAYSATRRAIVRAAAEIGKAQP